MPNLDDTLKRLIARDLRIRPEEITTEFVRKWRKSKKPGELRLEFRSHYGGYRGSGLRRLTPEEIEKNRKRTAELLAQ